MHPPTEDQTDVKSEICSYLCLAFHCGIQLEIVKNQTILLISKKLVGKCSVLSAIIATTSYQLNFAEL